MESNGSVEIEVACDELLANVNKESSWILENGRDGWLVDRDATFGVCFTSSYRWCKKSQLIDVISLGYQPKALDAQPHVHIVDFFWGCGDSESKYALKVELLDRNKEQLGGSPSALFEYSSDTIPIWQLVSHTFEQYGTGLRFINFEQSCKLSKVAGSSVTLEFPAGPLKDHQGLQGGIQDQQGGIFFDLAHPSGVTKYPDQTCKRAISRIIALWSLDEISGFSRVGTIIRPNNNFLQDAKKWFSSSNVQSTRIDLQWNRDDKTGIAVQIDNVTYAQVNLPVNVTFGKRTIRHLLLRSMEEGKLIEVTEGDIPEHSRAPRDRVEFVAKVRAGVTIPVIAMETTASR